MANGAEFKAALFALHERMLAGDPTLLGDVARLVLEPLKAQVRQAFRTVDDQLVEDGVADALLEYGRNPSQANATAGAGVLGFLVMRAKSRVIDTLRKDRRRDIAEAGYAHEMNPSAERGRGNLVALRRATTEHSAERPSASVSVPPPDVEDRLERESRVAEVLSGAKSEVDRSSTDDSLGRARDVALRSGAGH
jgi:DNA-directed RNA polymerase specialized sigma24 family protein